MGLETVVDDIKEEARARADQIVEEAEEEADEIVEDAREEAEGIKEEEKEAAEKEAEELREQELSSAKLEARKMESRERREILTQTRADARDALAELKDGREELTRKLLDASIEELGEDSGVVYAAEKDTEMVKELLEEYDGYSYGGTKDIIGGVVVEASDGDVSVNNSFDSVLETVWKDSLKQISERVFGE